MQINIENYEYAESIDETALTDLIRQLAALAQAQSRTPLPWQELTVHILSDRTIAPVHVAVNGVEGTTDVITQRYDPFPGEPEGLIGEIFVNMECVVREGVRGQESVVRRQGAGERSQESGEKISEMNPESGAGWSADRELALYIAHGCDHLNDNEDLSEEGYLTMRSRELSWLAQLRLTPVIIKPIM